MMKNKYECILIFVPFFILLDFFFHLMLNSNPKDITYSTLIIYIPLPLILIRILMQKQDTEFIQKEKLIILAFFLIFQGFTWIINEIYTNLKFFNTGPYAYIISIVLLIPILFKRNIFTNSLFNKGFTPYFSIITFILGATCLEFLRDPSGLFFRIGSDLIFAIFLMLSILFTNIEHSNKIEIIFSEISLLVFSLITTLILLSIKFDNYQILLIATVLNSIILLLLCYSIFRNKISIMKRIRNLIYFLPGLTFSIALTSIKIN